jgi:hypothetical protein
MLVYTADGVRLGRVTHLDEESFRVEEDRILRRNRDYEVYYREIKIDEDGVVRVERSSDQFGDSVTPRS